MFVWFVLVVPFVLFGEVAERPNAGALKAPEGKLSGGSNPSLAAMIDPGALALLIAIDIVIVAGGSIAVGAVAPRCPSGWFGSDRGPLQLTALDTPRTYRTLGVTTLTRRLPELGNVFGGKSKAALPGTDRTSIEAYLREVRRAEWVHWTSSLTVIPLWWFNPWWLALAFTAVVVGGNALFMIVLRHNRLRLLRILKRG